MDPTRKRVLITGANKGIGLATVAAVLAARADTGVLLGSRDRDRGEGAREQLLLREPTWKNRIRVLVLDVADDDSVRRAVEQCLTWFGGSPPPLYGMVNNAGIGLPGSRIRPVLEVNTYGTRRVCEGFLPLLHPTEGRIVNISSASGPTFVASCSPARQELLTDPVVTWAQVEALMEECLSLEAQGAQFDAHGLADSAYGLSKACVNAYTIELARRHPALVINACTPGYIETDLTRPTAVACGRTPRELGMKAPREGTRAALHLLFGAVGGTGWYFGSDAERSPMDRYRSPGDPPYTGA